MRFWTFTDAFGSFRRFRGVVTCYNWASIERCSSVAPVFRYVLTIISVKILHKFEETLLTVTHITATLTFKRLSEKWP